jgi:hypothetical protein
MAALRVTDGMGVFSPTNKTRTDSRAISGGLGLQQ